MSQQLYSLSLDAIKYICNLINQTVDLPSTILDDLHIATNTTYSSYKLDTLLKALKEENIQYCDAAIAGLNKLSKEVITDKSQITNENTIYLLLTDPNKNVYEQWLLINGTPVMIGTTEMNLDNVYTKQETDDRYALLTDFNDLKTAHDTLKEKVGDTTKLKNATLVEDVQEALNKSVLTTLTSAQYQQLVANGSVTLEDGTVVNYSTEDYYLVKDDSDSVNITSNISSTSTDNEVPTAKAVYSKFAEVNGYVDAQLVKTDILDFAYNLQKKGMIPIRMDSFENSKAPSIHYSYTNGFIMRTGEKIGEARITVVIFPRDQHRRKIAVNRKYNADDWVGWEYYSATKVDDVAPTGISPLCTYPSGFMVNVDNSKYTVKNGFCTVVMLIKITSCASAFPWTVVASGLPKTSYQCNTTIYPETGGSLPLCVKVTEVGQLNFSIAGTITTPTWFTGSFTYPVAES